MAKEHSQNTDMKQDRPPDQLLAAQKLAGGAFPGEGVAFIARDGPDKEHRQRDIGHDPENDEVDVETENTTEESEYGDLGRSKSAFSEKERDFNNSEESETVEPILEKRDAEPIDSSPSQVSIIVCIRIMETSKFFSFFTKLFFILKVIDIGSLYDKRGVSPLLYASRHLAYCFLLSDQKGNLKSDRLVRVSVKNLALNCLVLVGSLEPLTWETSLSLPSGNICSYFNFYFYN